MQKVLYYGYGGPGDLTGTYLKQYNEDVRYILTHLAASYAYAGESAAFVGCYESGIQKYGVREYINYLYSPGGTTHRCYFFIKHERESVMKRAVFREQGILH